MREFTTIIGRDLIEKRRIELEALFQSPSRRSVVLRQYGLERACSKLTAELELTGRCRHPDTQSQLQLYGLATMHTRVRRCLQGNAKHKLDSALRGYYSSDTGLRPLAYEFVIAGHLMRHGFDVRFHDIEVGSGFDLLASNGAVAIEVECKHISADVGRKIHNNEFNAFVDTIASSIVAFRSMNNGGWHLSVEVLDRLSKNRDVLSAMKLQLDHVLASGACIKSSALAKISLESTNLSSLDLRGATLTETRKFFQKVSGHENAHHAYYEGRSGFLLVTLTSAQPDSVIPTLYKRLKGDVKKQFTGIRTAMLFAHLADLSGAELVALSADEKQSPTGLQRMANGLLNNRKHLLSCVFTADDGVEQARLSGQTLLLSIKDVVLPIRTIIILMLKIPSYVQFYTVLEGSRLIAAFLKPRRPI